MESEQNNDVSSSEENNDSISSIIKIELEKVIDNTDDNPARAVGSIHSNREKVPESSIDTTAIINNNRDSTRQETQDQAHNTSTRITSSEAPVTGIRYFEGIGKDLPGISDGIHKSLEKPAVPVSDNSSHPYTVNIVHSRNSGNPDGARNVMNREHTYKDIKYGNVELYATDTGPRIYNVKGNIISRPIITKNLPAVYRAQPVHGKAESKDTLNDFYEQKIRDYVGYGISDSEFGKLQKYMDGDYLRTGLELTTPYTYPSQGPLSADIKSNPLQSGPGKNLCIVKKLELRIKKDLRNHYPRKLKYRGLRMQPLALGEEDDVKEMPELNSNATDGSEDGPLEPGRDLIFRARIYRPHSYGSKDQREQKSTRHSVFNNDLVALGRQRLTAFRDRLACANDVGMRVDISHNPDCYTVESAKELFPSGFLFINNVFYVDRRRGCLDRSAPVRDWARRRGLGDFPVRDMGAVRLDQLVLRLGHPEVYMHQGKCEHLFTFSEVRLLAAGDPRRLALYPRFTLISQNQSVYCTTCAEFGAKWIVVGCTRVPFDPAFFCDTCFRLYLYDRHGNKIGDFKAYSYRGHSVNFMRPAGQTAIDKVSDCDDDDDDE